MPTPLSPVLTGPSDPTRPAASGSLVAEIAAPVPLCDVCRHTEASHDAISRRFCAATLNGALTRGCICRPS